MPSQYGDIIVVGQLGSLSFWEFSYWNWGWNSYSDTGGGGGGGAEPAPQPTLEQQAEQFAEGAIDYGPGFDPNNPAHQKIAAKAKEALKQAYLDAHDGVDGPVKGTDGQVISDAEMRGFLSQVEVTLSTGNLNSGKSADFVRGANDQGELVNSIYIDIDHANLGNLAGHFGSLDEAATFTVLHEIGHGLEMLFGGGATSEASANYLALQLGDMLGVPMPTVTEMGNAGYDIYTPPATDTQSYGYGYEYDYGYYGSYGGYYYY